MILLRLAVRPVQQLLFNGTAIISRLRLLRYGFKYNKNSNKWEEAKFDVDEKRYIVTREKSQKVGRKVAWTVKEYNQQETALICEDDFNPFGNLFCGGGIFRMNRFNLRYIYTLIGYYNSNIIDDKGRVISHEGGRGTFIELGSCR